MVGSANGMSMMTSSTRLPQNRSRTSTQAMIVPMTTLTTVTRSDCADGELDRRPGLGVGQRRARSASQPPPAATTTSGGERDQHQQAEPGHGDAEAEAGPRVRFVARASAGRRGRRVRAGRVEPASQRD